MVGPVVIFGYAKLRPLIANCFFGDQTSHMLRLIFAFLFFLLMPISAVAQADNFFKVDDLNVGLPDSPSNLDRLTPQTAIWSFLEAVQSERFDDAAHLLNLNDVPTALQVMQGPELAQKLATVLDRKVVVSWNMLLERPDSLNANLSSDAPMAGQSRRSLLLGILELDGRPVALRLNRVKPEEGDAVWVFSRQTVANIEPLFKTYGPSALERSLPNWMREKGPVGLFWWEIIGIPIILSVAGLIATFIWQGMASVCNRLGQGTAAKTAQKLRLPLTLIAVGAVISLSTSYIFVVSGIVSNILEPVLVLIFVTAAMVMAVNIIDGFLERIMAKDVEDLASPDAEDHRAFATTVFALRRLIVAIAVVAGVGITLTTANVFQTLGFSLLAGAGGLVLLLGFAAREVLGNILASMQISANRSARIGDQLIFEGKLCTVERIHFSFVQLKVWDRTRLIVPVSQFVSESFINRTLIDNDMIRNVVLTVAPTVNVDKLRRFYEDWMNKDDRVGKPDTYECLVTGQDEFGMKVRLCAHVLDPRDGWNVECELREAAVRYLDDNAIDALPHLGTTTAGKQDDAAASEAAE